jgi:hypothetical protein
MHQPKIGEFSMSDCDRFYEVLVHTRIHISVGGPRRFSGLRGDYWHTWLAVHTASC